MDFEPLKFIKKLGKKKKWFKYFLFLGISAIIDSLDFFIGRIPIFGTIFDIIGGFVSFLLWGSLGLISFWEVLEISDQADGFIPTLTLVGLLSIYKQLN